MFAIKRYRLSKSINELGLDLTSMTTTTVKRLLTNQMCAMHSTNQFTEKNTSDQKNPDKKTRHACTTTKEDTTLLLSFN